VWIKTKSFALKVNGSLPHLFYSSNGSESGRGCGTIVFYSGNFKAKNLLKPFLFYLLALCLPEENELRKKIASGPFTLFYVAKKKSSDTKEYELKSWTPFTIQAKDANVYLQNLIEALFNGDDFDLLPFSIIEAKLTKDNQLLKNIDFRQELLVQIEEIEDLNSDYPIYKPTETISLIDPKIPDDANQKIQQRFSLFFNSAFE